MILSTSADSTVASCFDSARNIQARDLPVGYGEIGDGELRGERDDEEVAGKAAEADDDGRTYFAAA